MEVHSYGKCDPNVDAAALADFQSASGAVGRSQKKLDTLAKYKFCVVSELGNAAAVGCQNAGVATRR